MTWSTATLDALDARRKERLARVLHGRSTDLDRLWLNPHLLMDDPDPWQVEVLEQLVSSNENAHILCSRGAGKSYTFAAAAYAEGGLGGFSVIFSRSDKQALEVMGHVKDYHNRWRIAEVVEDNMHSIRFTTGGRILVRPHSSDTVVGLHGVTLLGVDEAAIVQDTFFARVTPMLGVSEAVTGIKPRMALMSTPYGKRGFFWQERYRKGANWRRHKYDWRSCPRIKPETVEEYRKVHGEFWYRQEYLCEFLDAASCPFDMEAFERCLTDEPEDW